MEEVVSLFCADKTILSVVGDKLIAEKNGKKNYYPMDKISSFSFTEATFYNGGGTISISLYGANTGFIHWGFGVATSTGADRTFTYKIKEQENANKIRDKIESYLDLRKGGEYLQAEHLENKKVVSVADEIRDLKSLLDDGILTQDEFTEKKKQLLGI